CFAPERAQRLWAIARKELEPAIFSDAEGQPRITLPGRGLDAGSYSRGFVGAYGGIMAAAREFGDEEIAQAAQRSLDQDCSPVRSGGSLSYLDGSNLSNVNVAMARLMRTGDFRRSFVEGPSEATLAGPYLTGVSYPDVLVARAYSNGENLELVLRPGGTSVEQRVTVKGLKPARRYQVTGCREPSVVAEADGVARLVVNLN